MKKIIYLLMMFTGIVLVSCEKDEIGGTATKELAGEWYVTVDAVDADGAVIYDDVFGLGSQKINTYNTASNVSTEMYVDDLENIWSFKTKVVSDINKLSFHTDGDANNEYYDTTVKIEDGKILKNAATNPHGTKSDSIVFYVTFGDDDKVPDTYSKLKVSGYRYTGLASDD